MYCLLCHAKIPRLRAWRTKSEFCCDEHAEAYKNQMLDRLMVNEGESTGKKTEKATLPTAAEIGAAHKAKTQAPVPAAKEETEVSAPLGKQRGGSLLGLGSSGSSTAPSPREELTPAPAARPKEQTAEQALAALRELAESASQRSKGKQKQVERPAAEAPKGDPAGELALSETSARPESEDVFDELRELAGRALPSDADLESDEAEAGQDAGELDILTRSSALERLMQEAVNAEQAGNSSEETESLEIDELLRRDAEYQAETVSAAPKEEIEEPLAGEAIPEFAELTLESLTEEEQEQPAMAADKDAREAAEEVETTPAQASEATPAEPAVKASPGRVAAGTGRDNVVLFPSAGAEEPLEPKEEEPQVTKGESEQSTARAPDQDAKAARSSEPKKAAGHPLLRAKVTLEPLLDLFSMEHGEPAVEASQVGWEEFVRQVRGERASLKDMNGVIETQVLPSYPAGPSPALRVSDLASDFALFDTLPASEDGRQLEIQPAGAEIADFDAACVHPELVFLNFSLSTTQVGGLVDVAEWISRSVPLSGSEAQVAMRRVESQLAEPSFTPVVPSGFLLRCGDLSLSEDPGFLAGELLMMGMLPTNNSGAAAPEGASGTAFSGQFRKLNQPSMGTEFPDRLFDGVEGSSSSGGQLTAGDLAGAEPASRDLPSGAFPPIEGAGKTGSGKNAPGVFAPVFETKRPLDRDLSDYV